MLTGQHPPHHAFGLAACFPGVVAVGWWEKVSQLLPRAGRPQLPCPGRRHLSPPLPSPGFAFPVPGPGHNLHCEWWSPPLSSNTHSTHARVFWEGGGKLPSSVKRDGSGAKQAQTEAPFIAQAGRPRAAANTNAGGSEPAHRRPRSSPRPRRPALAPRGLSADALESQTPRGHRASTWLGVTRRPCTTVPHHAAHPQHSPLRPGTVQG